MMRTAITAIAASAIIAGTAITMPTEALAYRYHHHFGGFGAGLATGVIGGAIIGGTLANRGYYGGQDYYSDDYYGCRRVLMEDNYGNRFWRQVCN